MIIHAGAAMAEKYPNADEIAVVIPMYKGSPPILRVMGPNTATVPLELIMFDMMVVRRIFKT
tara:strand:- start:56 stop:241 length:186 start_codon:yes stop_codon:yes gene_type:complete